MRKMKNFLAWLENINRVPAPETLRWREWQVEQQQHRNQRTEDQIRAEFLDIIIQLHQNGEMRALDFNQWGHTALVLQGTGPSAASHYALHFANNTPLVVTKFRFKDLSANSAPAVHLNNVWLDTLELRECRNVSLENCFIGTLRILGVAASTFEMRGGAILNIETQPPSAQVPFTGSVYFDKRVFLPRRPGLRLKGPQPYRNMRAHMLKLENTPMVGLFHTLEQATERKMEGYGFHRAISALYEYLSDYGSSALRPFMFFIGIFGITFLLILLLDGAAHANAAELAGWQESLVGNDWFARVRRAFVLAGQATLNPLGVFGIKGLLVAKTGWLALWLSVHGLLSTLFVALFIFAIRRRFKMG